MGSHCWPTEPIRPVYTALFLLLLGLSCHDGGSSRSSKQRPHTVAGPPPLGYTYVDFQTVTVYSDTAYGVTLHPGLTSLARHCFCLPGARGFFVPKHRRSPSAVVVALLLIMGGVKSNPSPAANANNNGAINLGCLNVRSAVNKSAEIHSIIAYHNFDLLAVTETWIAADAPLAVKADIAPSGY